MSGSASAASQPVRRPTLRLNRPLPPAAAAAIAKAKPPPPPPPSPKELAAAAMAQRIAWRAADLALCRERWPALFDPDRPLPLAIGVHRQLAPHIGFKRAQRLLLWWSAWASYVAAIAAGGSRYNLDGSAAGDVTEYQRSIAEASIARHSGPAEAEKTAENRLGEPGLSDTAGNVETLPQSHVVQ